MELAALLFIISGSLFIVSAFVQRDATKKISFASKSFSTMASSYAESLETTFKLIDNISKRTDNLHERTNDLEHDVAIHNLLLPLLIEALNITAAKKLLEDYKIKQENFG